MKIVNLITKILNWITIVGSAGTTALFLVRLVLLYYGGQSTPSGTAWLFAFLPILAAALFVGVSNFCSEEGYVKTAFGVSLLPFITAIIVCLII